MGIIGKVTVFLRNLLSLDDFSHLYENVYRIGD
jgi:hypothetical protein